MSKLKNSDLIAVICLLVISLLAEVFVFNFRYFEELAARAPHMTVKASDFTGTKDCVLGENGLMVAQNSMFIIGNPGIQVNSLKFNTNSGTSFTVDVTFKDENSSKSEINAGSWTVDPSVTGSDHIRFITSGKCSQITFYVSSALSSPEITSVELNSPYFQFRFARLALLFFILLFIYLVRRKKLWDRHFDLSNSGHRDVLFFIFFAAALLSVTLCFLYGSTQTFSADMENDGDCYRLLTEAFSHGSLSFLGAPPEALKLLSNPYDNSARNFSYIFDSAYFNGHYYCYFGITPIITLLLPFKLLTGLYMPTSFACLIFMLILLFALTLLYCKITERWFPHIGFMPFICGAAAVLFGSNLFWLIARPMFYELAVLCALCFLLLGLLLLMRAQNAKHPVLTLCFSGLCFALMVAARPTFLFYLASALPFILPLIIKKDGKYRLQGKNAAAFFAPLAVFAVILMAYNFARFGSPFNFGQQYQLTVSDVRFNKVTDFAAIPGGIYHYFFAPLGVDLTYPFFHIIGTDPTTSSGFYYNQPMAGVFNFPLLLILFASVYIIKRIPKKRIDLKHFAAILLIASLVITYLDITLAGVLERYLLDIMPMLTLVSIILWFELIEHFRQKGAAGPVAKLFCVICMVTAVISTLCSAVGEYGIQLQNNPQIYQKLAAMFEFWR